MANVATSRRMLPMLLLAATLAFAPAALDAQGPTFKSSIDMVPLTVTVTDATGKYVTGLSDQDFTVLEDGVAQPLSFFARESVPVDVALVLDTSGSMGADLPLVQAAARGLVQQLRPSDRGAVVEVKDNAGMAQPFTSDRGLLEQAIRGLSASGNTSLYDGLYIVLREFERERRAAAQVRRQALVLLSDGLDTRSRLSADDVLELARRVGVNIYVIALKSGLATIPRQSLDGSILRADYAMGAVARESGGRTYQPKSARELPAIYTAIAQELASQYELGYTPVRPGGDGAFRRVLVRIAAQANALARTRSGYYATRTMNGR